MGNATSNEDDFALPQQQIVNQRAGRVAQHGSRDDSSAMARKEDVSGFAMPVTWEKTSIKLIRDSCTRTLWSLHANFTATEACEYVVHFHSREVPQYGGGLEFEKADEHAPDPQSFSYSRGSHVAQKVELDMQRNPLDFYWTYKRSRADVIPIVMLLRTSRATALLYVHLSAVGSEIRAKMYIQKAIVDYKVYVIEEIFGLAELGKEVDNDSNSHGEPCVVCLTDPRTTAVLPCRHMCVCRECAGALSAGAGGKRCPICRGRVDGVEVFEMKA